MAVAAVPIRAITSGPGRHWFGYYDKLQFDPTSRYVLGMRVDFEGRQPRPDDTIAVGVIDLEAGDAWREVGRTRAWCWQQGCMLQWIPGSDRRIIWNDREGDRYVSRILDLDSGASRTLPAAIYAVAPDGRTAIGTDFRRLDDMRPGYGYAGVPDPNREVPAPEDAGIYTLDLTAPGAEPELVIPVADVAALPYPHGDIGSAKHYFNHLLFNTDGSRFIFLHRWRCGRRQDDEDAHRGPRWIRPARRRRLRQDVALHLARPADHPGLVLATGRGRGILPPPGSERRGERHRLRHDDQ